MHRRCQRGTQTGPFRPNTMQRWHRNGRVGQGQEGGRGSDAVGRPGGGSSCGATIDPAESLAGAPWPSAAALIVPTAGRNIGGGATGRKKGAGAPGHVAGGPSPSGAVHQRAAREAELRLPAGLVTRDGYLCLAQRADGSLRRAGGTEMVFVPAGVAMPRGALAFLAAEGDPPIPDRIATTRRVADDVPGLAQAAGSDVEERRHPYSIAARPRPAHAAE
jgi:hypothetical protein